ncbi:MBL fold metallo-hydrolase [Halocatena pleomorpha]|uniref:MBL fold metallo-hydrolase n=1 Tax=Halocatena pleomorpha TaxID=1785090 RepID=A0A3P3RL07_9EURY|nr:MBL fold metallo-hydrolase [Halocatena pleomorpha]RRJ33578.1 MBL fold metallo-hydrolase [Halocatena pleomorpha]
MHISYQHANPFHGRESVVVRIEGLLPDQTVCLLIDAGEGVDVDTLLEGDDEYLTAICLTHAHLDHYTTLAENLRDAAPIYTAPDTASILADVIDAGEGFSDPQTREAVLDRVTPLEGWTTIVDGLRVRPVPVGHTPAATGILLSIEDGNKHRTILTTGDFTLRRAAGYPGFEPDLPVDVDVLLLNAASSEDIETTLTATVSQLIKRALAGSTVLATTSGLTGVHLAYLLGHLAHQYDLYLPVTLVGHAGTLADQLGYDIPAVSTQTEFTDPNAVLDSGTITIAGPEVPTPGGTKSADRLFSAIEDDPGATLIQVLSGTDSPVRTASCTVHDAFLSNHPSRESIDTVVDQLMPVHVVVMHQAGPEADRYKDKFASYVWVTDDQTRHTLLDEHGWTPPPWVSAMTRKRVESSGRTTRRIGEVLPDGDTNLLFPSTDRYSEVDLTAEGLDVETLTQSVPQLTEDSQEEAPETAADTSTHMTQENEASALQQVFDRLDQLENTLQASRYPARVLDVHDGVTILRVDTELPAVDVGDTVGVVSETDTETDEN